MSRDYGKEIDQLRDQLNELVEKVLPKITEEWEEKMASVLPNKPSEEVLDRVHVMHGMHPDERLSQQMEELCYKTEKEGTSGFVTYMGVYNAGGRQSNWIRNDVPTDGLLSQIESGIASKVLVCIGNANRLAILLEILRGPKTVAELVEQCGFGSTGQAYHHLKPLLAADLVAEDDFEKGVYGIRPHKVQGIIMLLAGISDMVDETYTQGAWDISEETEDSEGSKE